MYSGLRKPLHDASNLVDKFGDAITDERLFGKALEKAIAPRHCWRGWYQNVLIAADLQCKPLNSSAPATYHDVILPRRIGLQSMRLGSELRAFLGTDSRNGLRVVGTDLPVWTRAGNKSMIVGNVDARCEVIIEGRPGEPLPPPGGVRNIPTTVRVGVSLKSTRVAGTFPDAGLAEALRGLRRVAPCFVEEAPSQRTLADCTFASSVYAPPPDVLAALVVLYDATSTHGLLKDVALAFWPVSAVADPTLDDACLLGALYVDTPRNIQGDRPWYAIYHRGLLPLVDRIDMAWRGGTAQVQHRLHLPKPLMGARPVTPTTIEATQPPVVIAEAHEAVDEGMNAIDRGESPDEKARRLDTEATAAEARAVELQLTADRARDEAKRLRRLADDANVSIRNPVTTENAERKAEVAEPPVHGEGMCPRCQTWQHFKRKTQCDAKKVRYWMLSCQSCNLQGHVPGSRAKHVWTY